MQRADRPPQVPRPLSSSGDRQRLGNDRSDLLGPLDQVRIVKVGVARR